MGIQSNSERNMNMIVQSKATTPFDDKRREQIILLCVFLIPTLFLIAHTCIFYGRLYFESDDGNLYLSIADNLIGNGHFIQNARIYENGMVVPFGLPLILTLLKLIVNNTLFIVLFQYGLFGATCLCLYLTERNIFGSGIGLSVIIYTFSMLDYPGCTPSYILTETYYLFLLALSILILSSPVLEKTKKVYALDCLLFLATVIRPVLSVLFIVACIFTIVMTVIKRLSLKRTIIVLAVPFLLIGLNTLVNYRETGYFITLENYSGVSMYLANNPNTKTVEYNSSLGTEFAEEEYFKIQEDSSLNNTEKDGLLKKMASQYIMNNPNRALTNVFSKFKIMFIDNWGLSFYLSVICVIGICLFRKEKRTICLVLFGSLLITSIVTAAGLNIPRYSICALPFLALFKAGLFGSVAHWINSRILQKF